MAELTFVDLTASGNTQNITLGPTVAKQGWILLFARLVTPFVSSDGTLVSTAITVGDGGSATRYLASMELNAAGSFVNVKAGALAQPTGIFFYTSGDSLIVAFTATVAKALNTHTAGKVLLFFSKVEGRTGQGDTVSGAGNN